LKTLVAAKDGLRRGQRVGGKPEMRTKEMMDLPYPEYMHHCGGWGNDFASAPPVSFSD